MSLEDKFRVLVNQWHRETDWLSQASAIMSHPAHVAIIEMGEHAIPMILRELRDNGGHWYKALAYLTGENPINESIRGKVQLMRQCWVDWGIEHGYLKEEG
jgi:hypothetical protein